MARQSRERLRELTSDEQRTLQQVARSRTEMAEVVARAKSVLAVAGGMSFAAGARAGGRRSGYGVLKLVARFNLMGLEALRTQPGAGHPVTYTAELRAQVFGRVSATAGPRGGWDGKRIEAAS